jgi:hypothetical protein
MRYAFKITQYQVRCLYCKMLSVFDQGNRRIRWKFTYDKRQIAPRVLGEVLFNLASVCQWQLLTRKPERKQYLW